MPRNCGGASGCELLAGVSPRWLMERAACDRWQPRATGSEVAVETRPHLCVPHSRFNDLTHFLMFDVVDLEAIPGYPGIYAVRFEIIHSHERTLP